MRSSLTLIVLGVATPLVASKQISSQQSYNQGKSFAQSRHSSTPNQNRVGEIPGYKGSNVSESGYLDNFEVLSEKATNLLHGGEKDSKNKTKQAGSLLRESVAKRSQFKIDPDKDPLIKKSNKIVAQPLKEFGEVTVTFRSGSSLKESLHTCEESADPATYTCDQKRIIHPTTFKKKVYWRRHIYGTQFRRIGRNYGAWCQYSWGPSWAAHDQSYDYYDYKALNKPSVTKSHFDGCGTYWHSENPEFKDVDSIKDIPDADTYDSNCAGLEKLADEGLCVYGSVKLIDGPGTKEITGSGTEGLGVELNTLKVKRDWWHRKLTYICQYKSKNNCGDLRAKGCVQIKSHCKTFLGKTFQGPTCVEYQQTFKCQKKRCGLDRVSFKGKVPFCMDGDCDDHGWLPNQDFAEVMSKLSIFREMAKDMDAKNATAFKGQKMQCSKSMMGFQDCCGSGGWGMSIGLATNCKESEKALSKLRRADKCVYVGTYCAERMPITKICMRKKSTYCCFGTKLSRILHEQGRRQVGIDWGEAEHPNCRGFTITELSRLNFDHLNLSELYSDIRVKQVNYPKLASGLKDNWKAKMPQMKKKFSSQTQINSQAYLNRKGLSQKSQNKLKLSQETTQLKQLKENHNVVF